MDPLTLMGIAAALGIGKGLFFDKPKATRAKQLNAERSRYSPWTGFGAQPVKDADPIGSGMQFGFAGAQLGQNLTYDKFLKHAYEDHLGVGPNGIAAPAPAGAAGAAPTTQASAVSPWTYNPYA